MNKPDASSELDFAGLSRDKAELLQLLLRTSKKVERIGRYSRNDTIEGTLPTSWSQRRLWFIDQLEGGSAEYNLGVAVRLRGTLDEEALRAALDSLLERHEILRTTFVNINGDPRQKIAAVARFHLTITDVSGHGGEECEKQVHLHKTEEVHEKFDLRRGPLIRGRLIRVREDEHVLVLMMHHIISDGWSNAVMVRELAEMYTAHRQDRKLALKDLSIQYADYAQWQHEWLQGPGLERQMSYWRECLKDAPPQMHLPTDHPRPAAQSHRGDSVKVVLDKQLTADLKVFAQRHQVTLFMVLCAAWAALLSRLSGQEDIVIGTPIANRQRPELEELIGFFVNTVVLRVRAQAGMSVAELLENVRRVTLDAYDHQDVPFERIVEELHPQRVLGRNPLFQVMFALQNAPKKTLQLPDLNVAFEEIPYQSAKFDLLLGLNEEDEEIVGTLEFATDLFVLETMERWVQHFVALLKAMMLGAERAIGDWPLLPETERKRITESFNPAPTSYPENRVVHELFEEQALRNPGAVAIEHAGRLLTYERLNNEADRLARRLRELGAGPNELVAICADRGLEMIVGLLGILKAGAAYVPLDPNYPSERLRHMLEDAKPRLVLTTAGLVQSLPQTQSRVVALNALLEVEVATAADVAEIPGPDAIELCSSDLVYVIYTSGTTGRPKGTAMRHRSMVNLIEWHRSSLPLVEGQRVLQFAALSFDVAFQEIFSTLCMGGTLVMLDEWVRKDARALTAFINEHAIERLFVPPLMLQSLAEHFKTTKVPLRSLRDVITAGEQLRISTEIVDLFKHLDGCLLHNHYGPTETHVVTSLTLAANPDDWPRLPTIGRPIANTRIDILDPQGHLVPIGVVGEIYIGGANVARGYLNKPDLTRSRFIPDQLCIDGDAHVYKTGDVGRWRADGTIEYLGRNDDQVKIRGFRVELGEIEARLALHAKIKEAAVIAREDVPGEKRLVAYFTLRDEAAPGVEELRNHLETSLPEHMVPSAFVKLRNLPLTPNGKLDRRALPAPGVDAYATRQYEAPQGNIEETIAGIWCELLRVERVGRRDNFFALGGHSLLMVQLLERLRRVGLIAELRSVYESATLEALARVLTGGEDGNVEVPPNLIPPDCEAITPQMLPLVDLEEDQIASVLKLVPGGACNVQDIYPLAPLQEGMLFHHLMDERGGDTYLISMLMSLPSRDRLTQFIDALQWVVDRHDILRSSVQWEQLPRAVHVVQRRATLPVEEIVLSQQGDPVEQLEELMRPDRQRLDIRKAPLMRLQIAADPHSDQWFVILQLHHLVCDHESLDTMLMEVMTYLNGNGRELPQPLPYRNHVGQALRHAETHDADAFFRNKLSDVEEPTAPFGLLDVNASSDRIDNVDAVLEAALANRIRIHARRLGVSPATLFHAAWALVVSHTSGRDDVVFGTVLLGRLQGSAGAQRILGLFMNTLPLRVRLHDLSVTDLVELTQRELVDLLTHEQASLAAAQRCSGIIGSTPLFSTLLNYRWRTIDLQAEYARWGLKKLAIHSYTNYPITVSVLDQGEGFQIDVRTDRSIDPRRIMAYFNTAVGALVESLEKAPEEPALTLPILPEGERDLVLKLFNGRQMTHSEDALAHEAFERQAERTPAAIAAVCGDQQWTYAQLNGRANRLAHTLIGQGVKPDDLVAICVERSGALLTGLLGILKAGAAYVPLDPHYPTERLAHMLSHSSPRVIITEQRLKGALPPSQARLISIDEEWESIACARDENPCPKLLGLTSQHLAYVIYTSGSTGLPKGVMVEHRNLTNLVHWHCAAFGVRQGFRSSCLAALGFDAAVWEIWPSLSVGATVVLAPREVAQDPERLLDWWTAEPLDISFLPTPLAELAFTRSQFNERLRTLLVGGDRLRYRPASMKFSLVNNYGPTEATVVATSGPIEDDDAVLHIGRPVSNAKIYILDSRRAPVPIGVAGEIYIGGGGVARGYLRAPELTRERFVLDPFSADPQVRMYRTGDLARWRPDGTIEYLGRNDHQVKIRGFRIELGEIESQLARLPEIKDAVVVVREDVPGEKRLVSYVISANPDAPMLSAEQLRARLKAVLPEYMIPAAFVVLERFPFTPNGKMDRKALPPPEMDAYASPQYEAPQGEVEETLATIWRQVLDVKRVGRDDSFFELGGHSLLVLRAIFEIGRHFGCALRVSDMYKNSTVRELARRLGGAAAHEDFVDLSREAGLDEQIRRGAAPRNSSVGSVLLTGATGFVGRFLLAQILRDTSATVHCVVRATSRHEAAYRLRAVLAKWDLWREDYESRIVAVPGDLRRPRLGIDESTYEDLCHGVDAIFHCATSMNHLETYSMAKPANVGSAIEVLRLATRRKQKVVNYISTLGVFSPRSTDILRTVDERSSIDKETHPSSGGYVASKWVSEKIFMTAAEERGIASNIFRLGLVWADTEHGRYDELQREYRLLKSSLLLGCGIENYRFRMPPAPVDYVARAIVYLANRYQHGHGIFHISSSHEMPEGLFESCNEVASTQLELMPYELWVAEIKRYGDERNPLPIAPLIEFASSSSAFEGGVLRPRHGVSAGGLRFEWARTRDELEAGGITAPVIDDTLLFRCLEDMFSRDPDLRELQEYRSKPMLAARAVERRLRL